MKAIKITVLSALVLLIVGVSGCYYDNYPAITGVDEDVSFVDDLVPIWNASCNSTGCHSSGGISPDLTASKAYSDLVDGGFVNVESPESSSLYRSLIGEISLMPVSGKLADSEISLVLGWIQQGALDN